MAARRPGRRKIVRAQEGERREGHVGGQRGERQRLGIRELHLRFVSPSSKPLKIQLTHRTHTRDLPFTTCPPPQHPQPPSPPPRRRRRLGRRLRFPVRTSARSWRSATPRPRTRTSRRSQAASASSAVATFRRPSRRPTRSWRRYASLAACGCVRVCGQCGCVCVSSPMRYGDCTTAESRKECCCG